MFQRPGSGFLGSALTTAAGVAGGVIAGNALMDLFSGGRGGFGGGGFGGGGFGGGNTTIIEENNPWGGGGTQNQGYVDQGTWNDTSSAGAASNPGYVDNGTWDTSGGSSPAALPDNSSDPGWDTRWRRFRRRHQLGYRRHGRYQSLTPRCRDLSAACGSSRDEACIRPYHPSGSGNWMVSHAPIVHRNHDCAGPRAGVPGKAA